MKNHRIHDERCRIESLENRDILGLDDEAKIYPIITKMNFHIQHQLSRMKYLLSLALIVLAPSVQAQELDSLSSGPSNFDILWVLVSAALVFLMQAGFKCLEVGMMRKQHSTIIGMKNVIDWAVVCLTFFIFGFGFMFGESGDGFIGWSLFALDGMSSETGNKMGPVFFLFQLGFAAAAVTIVSGSMAERTGFVTYLCASILIGSFIYPIFGFWAWGNLFIADNKPWLAQLGFMDFAGATVVHSLGAWVALIGVWIIGPRLGRYDKEGKLRPFKCYNIAYAILGVLILCFGWWGFNGGSTLKFDYSVGMIILNTNLAAAAGGFAAFLHSYFCQQKQELNEKLLGGVLGGLVAITACCNVVTPAFAILVGLIAGIVHNLSFDLIIKKFRLDDSIGAIPVHGFCGAFGTLAVALFGKEELLVHPRMVQVSIQLIGIITCFAWASVTAFVVFKLCKRVVGLRVSPQEEHEGISIGGPNQKQVVESIDAATLRDLM